MNPPRTYSTRLAVVAKRRRLTERASREAQPKVSKPLQEVLDALHLDSGADLISCLLECEAFLKPWAIFRDGVVWEPNSSGLVIRTDDLIPQIVQEVKLNSLSQDLTPNRFDVYYHATQLYSSLIRNLQQKEEIFYCCEEDEYSDICKSLAKLASFLRVQYKSGRGFLIRVIERAKPSRHAKLSAELIKTRDHPNAIEYREKRMVRMTVAVNLHEDEDYELLQGMFVDSANESIHHQAMIEEDRAEYNLNDRSSSRSANGNGCNKDRERSVKEMRIHNQDVETIAAVEVERVQDVQPEESQIDNTDKESKPIDLAKSIERSPSNVFETNDEQFRREDDGPESMAVERPSTQQRVMFTTASNMNRVQAATTQNAETEDENDQIVPIRDPSMDEDWVVKVADFAAEKIRAIDFAFGVAFNEDRKVKFCEEPSIHSSWRGDIVLKQLKKKQLAETGSDPVDGDTENSTMEFDISADGETLEGEMEDEDELAEKDVGEKTLVNQLNNSTSTNAISEVSTIDSARQRAKKHAPKPPAIFLPQMRTFSGSGKSGVKGHIGILRQQKAKITLYKRQLASGDRKSVV